MEAFSKGFLNSDYELFYILDHKGYEFEYHYHDFHKLIILLNGSVQYMIEGKSFFLQPYDMLLVRNSEIHKPVINNSLPYERVVVWMKNGNILENNEDSNVLRAFGQGNLIRFGDKVPESILSVLTEIKKLVRTKGLFYHELKEALTRQLILYVLREMERRVSVSVIHGRDDFDKTVADIMDYINLNMEGELSVDRIAEKFFMSKYHLMRKFKNVTGHTIHQFILKKRLFRAKELLGNGGNALSVSHFIGFKDYSTFVRAYKKMFGELPSNRKNRKIKKTDK